MKKLFSVFALSVLACFGLASSIVIAAPVIVPKPPQLAASSYILLDAKSGKVIAEHNPDMSVPPASLTKMMTSYIATHELSVGNLKEEEQVDISVKAWRKGGSKMFIREGTKVPLIDLVKGIIIQSGNDASIAVSEHIAGSEESFVEMMNQYAKSFGMVNTNFNNATGWPSEGHVSTARDMARLAKRIINDHPDYYTLYKEKDFTYNNIKQSNRNRLLFRDPTVDGLKTGHTEEAGFCLVASAKRDGMRLIAVVMGTRSEEARAAETQKLLTYGFRFFETFKLYEANTSLQTQSVWFGEEEEVQLGLMHDVFVTVPRGVRETLQGDFVINEIIEAPVRKGLEYGKLTVSYDDKVLIEKPLTALNEVEEAGFFSRIWDGIVLFFYKLFK